MAVPAARDGRRTLTRRTPQVLEDTPGVNRCERLLKIPEDLEYLPGHFPGFPVVPGVAQIGWVLDAAREVLGRPATLRAIESLKFKRPLRPADLVHLSVEVSPDRGTLDFRLWDDASLVSSGRVRLAPGRAPRGGVNACLLIPIFDHGETIGAVLEGLAPLGLPCLVVNDGSGRETTETLSALATKLPWVEVERLPVNRGRGAALQHGYRAARARGFSHAIQLDADGQHDPAEVGALLDAAEDNPDALILGAPRFDATAPLSRLYGRRLSQWIVWGYTGSFAVHDPLCGFRCFPLAATLGVLERYRFGDRMDFDPEIVVRLAWEGLPIVNVPVRVRYLAHGRSHFRLVRDNAHIAATYGRLLVACIGRRLRRARRRGDQRVTPGTGWLSAAERGSLLGMYFIVWCHRLFGRRLCAWLIVPVVGYFFLTGRAARRASRGYLARLHRWSESRGGGVRQPGWCDSFRHFHEFALNIIDRVSFFVGDTGEFEMIVHGREHLARHVGAGRGALVLSAHLGSFDALRLVADEGGVPLNVAMFLRNARMINAVFTRLNPSRPLRIIDLERAAPHSVFEIRACLQRGEFVGMLADRVGVGDAARVCRVPFFGERAAIPQGPFLLAGALKCPLLLMIGLRMDHRRYEVFVETLAEEVVLPSDDRVAALDALARCYTSRLEHYCLRAPYQWFNFYEFWDESATSPA